MPRRPSWSLCQAGSESGHGFALFTLHPLGSIRKVAKMENNIDQMLIDRIKSAFGRRMVFFVGAGISVPSGVPDFKRLNEEVIQSISGDELDTEDCDFLAENVRPEVMYQIAMDELRSAKDKLGTEVLFSLETFERCEPNCYHYFLAEAIKRGNWIFTTNPDNLIEAACQKLSVDYRRCYGRKEDEDFREYLTCLKSSNVPEPCIFKLHGSIEDGKGEAKYRTVRFALRQVGRGLFGPRREILEYFLKNFDFWFMGYSCRDDFSVFPVLSTTKSDSDMFWFEYDKGPLSLSVSEEARLRWEIQREEKKPLGQDRNLELMNINETLLQRRKKYKFTGDLGAFIEAKLCTQLGIDIARPAARVLKQSKAFLRWAQGKGYLQRYLFLARLFGEAGSWDRAVNFYKRAVDEAKTSSEQVKAKRGLADFYYRESNLRKEEEAVALYHQCIDLSENALEKASLKASVSNVQRRRGKDYYSDSYEKAQDAKREFESILGKQDRKQNLDYARCLNIYGLILYSLGRFEEARGFFQNSIEIKRTLGDVNGIAESENAMTLAFIQEGRSLAGQGKVEEGRSKFLEAIEHAEAALDCRRRVGNYRGYAQNCRNLAWPHSELMKLPSEEQERQAHFNEARNGYQAGISSWNRFTPWPPGEVVLFNNLLAGLYIDFCHRTQDQSQKERWIREVPLIYKRLLLDSVTKDVARSEKRTPTAEQNLTTTRDLLTQLNLLSEARETENILGQLQGE